MYEYAPISPKKREKTVAFLTSGLAVLLFGFSQIPSVPFPVVYQLLALASITVAILFATQYLMRRYTYRIEVREGAGEETAPDLVVTEYYGRRVSVVCRISVDDIESVTRVTAENRRELAAREKGLHGYSYCGEWRAENCYLLCVRHEDATFFLRILADKTLLSYFRKL